MRHKSPHNIQGNSNLEKKRKKIIVNFLGRNVVGNFVQKILLTKKFYDRNGVIKVQIQ